jgi:hypothetical protein
VTRSLVRGVPALLVLRGVPPGGYEISLKERAERVSDVVIVTIDRDDSSVDVELRPGLVR